MLAGKFSQCIARALETILKRILTIQDIRKENGEI